MSAVIDDPNDLTDEDFRLHVPAADRGGTTRPRSGAPLKRLHHSSTRCLYQKMSRKGWPASSLALVRRHGPVAGQAAHHAGGEGVSSCRRPYQWHGRDVSGPLGRSTTARRKQDDDPPKDLTGEYIWCQGYSEPNAGSDLASLQTAAVVDGDELVINGQKIWTSLAHDATHIYMLVRTDKTAKKKQLGISLVLADVKTPGITVRPIRNIAGTRNSARFSSTTCACRERESCRQAERRLDDRQGAAVVRAAHHRQPRRPAYALRRLELIARAKGLFADSGFADRYTALALDIQDWAHCSAASSNRSSAASRWAKIFRC